MSFNKAQHTPAKKQDAGSTIHAMRVELARLKSESSTDLKIWRKNKSAIADLEKAIELGHAQCKAKLSSSPSMDIKAKLEEELREKVARGSAHACIQLFDLVGPDAEPPYFDDDGEAGPDWDLSSFFTSICVMERKDVASWAAGG